MKKILVCLLLLVLARVIGAACLSNTFAYFTLDNAFTDTCGGTSLTQVGTLPFATSPAPPSPSTYWAGPYSSSNYAKASSTLVTAMNNAAAGTIEFAFQLNSIAANPVLFGTNNSNVYVQVAATGKISFGTTNGNNLDTATGLVTTGVSYYGAVTWDGTNKKTYLGTYTAGVLGTVSQVATVANAGTPFGSLTNCGIGFYANAGTTVNGYIGLVRYSSVARTSFPSVDPPASSPTFTSTITQTSTLTPTYTITPTYTATPTITNTSTATPTFTVTSTVTPTYTVTSTPCGLTYLEDFHAYPTAAPITTPGYVKITSSATNWTVQSGLTYQAAGAGSGGGWTAVRYQTSFANYFDWKTTVKLAATSGLFFHTSTYDSTPFPLQGYMLQVPASGNITLYREPSNVIIGYTTVTPVSYNNFPVEIVDNAGVIDVYIDRPATANGGPPAGNGDIHVIDLTATSGFWGWNTLISNSLFSNVSVNGGSCLSTNTPTNTPVPTPTANLTSVRSPCGSPWPQVFMTTPYATPVLVPQKTFEQGCVLEPDVLPAQVGGAWRMLYSANSFSAGGLRVTLGGATTTDPMALTGWTHSAAPLIGSGAGGESGSAYEVKQLAIGAEYRAYYSDDYGNKKFATSTDAINYSAGNSGTPVIAFNVLNQYGAVAINNMGFFPYDGSGTYYALVEARYTSGVTFRTWLFSSTDNALTFWPVGVGPLTSLDPSPGFVYGGPKSIVANPNGGYDVFIHANVPTSIYHAYTPDKFNYYPDSTYTLTYNTTMFGLVNCNQAADNSLIVVTVLGTTYVLIFYDGTDNVNNAGAIGVAVYPDTLFYLQTCGRPFRQIIPVANYQKIPANSYQAIPAGDYQKIPVGDYQKIRRTFAQP